MKFLILLEMMTVTDEEKEEKKKTLNIAERIISSIDKSIEKNKKKK